MVVGTEFSPSVLPNEVSISVSVFIPGAGISVFIPGAGFSDFSSGFVTAASSLCFIQYDTYRDKKDTDHISTW